MKIAVLGSCVTRDNFNSKFNPNYKEFFQCVVTQHQSSIITIMGDKIPVDTNLIDNLKPFDTWQILSEFNKEFFDNIKKEKPDYLILDFFGDVYFGVIKVGEKQHLTYVYNKLPKTTFYQRLSDKQKKPIRLDENKNEYMVLWKEAIECLFTFLRHEIPTCKVLLHQARFTKYYLTKDGEIKQLTLRKDAEVLNRLWNKLDEYVIENYPVTPIYVPGHYLSYEEHPWGAFGVHFTMNYYHNFLQELIRIVRKTQKNTIWVRLKSYLTGNV